VPYNWHISSTDDEAYLTEKTISDFGAQWTRFKDNRGYYASVDLLQDIFGPLFQVENLRGLHIVDIGSGTGRIVKMLLDAGAARVSAVEPSVALEVCRQNTAGYGEQVDYYRCTGEDIPDMQADLVVSIGVLHHIPDPQPTVQRAYQVLKPGGKFFFWIYGQEGNEAYLKLFSPLRKITRVLPDWALTAISYFLSVFLWLYRALCRVLPLPMHKYMRNFLSHLSYRQLVLTIFDQLNPAYAKYYPRHEAIGLMQSGGFKDIQIHHRQNYSWSVIGEKPAG